MVDITSLITLQAHARRNALRATRQIRRERSQAEEARTALLAATERREIEDVPQPNPFG